MERGIRHLTEWEKGHENDLLIIKNCVHRTVESTQGIIRIYLTMWRHGSRPAEDHSVAYYCVVVDIVRPDPVAPQEVPMAGTLRKTLKALLALDVQGQVAVVPILTDLVSAVPVTQLVDLHAVTTCSHPMCNIVLTILSGHIHVQIDEGGSGTDKEEMSSGRS